jgi:hypothetical protein
MKQLDDLRDQLYYIDKAEDRLQEDVNFDDLRREHEILKAELKCLKNSKQ